MFVKFLAEQGRWLTGEVILSEARLKRLVKRLKKVDEYAFDTETNTLRVQWVGEMELVGISMCFGEYDTYYIPTGHFFDKNQLPVDLVIKYLKPVFERPDVRIIGHNLKFDRHVLANCGIEFRTKDIFDTMLASWCIDENEQKGLKHLTNLVYDIPQGHFDECLRTVTSEDKKAFGLKASNKATFQLVRLKIGAPYAMADAYWTWRHYVDWTQDQLVKEQMDKIYYKKMLPFSDTLYKMERRGANIDADKLQKMAVKAEKDLEELEYKIIEIAGVDFNPGSGQQLSEILFGYKKFNKKGDFTGNMDIINKNFGFPILSKTDGGAPTTGDSALKALVKATYKRDKRKQQGQEMLKLILKYKKLNKLKSTFIDGLLKQRYCDGKVHPTFNLGGASSGRLSCSEPNLQQLPRPVEMSNPLNLEDWMKKFDIKSKEVKKAQKELKHLVIKDEYPTGDIKLKNVCSLTEDYCEYLKEWRAKNEENIFWKFYEIRDAFIPDNPEKESLIAIDYANLEMRLLAHFSGDPNLVEAVRGEHDLHGSTAVNMFSLDCEPDECKKFYHGLRQIAKTINFIDHSYKIA